MALADDKARVKFNASVAWTSFEMSASGAPRFRAGLNFEDADPVAVDAFCARHTGVDVSGLDHQLAGDLRRAEGLGRPA